MAEPLVRGLKRGRPRLPRAVDLETELPEDEDDEQAFAKRIAKITRPDLGVDYKIYLPHAQTFGQPDLPGGTFKYTTTLSDISPELGVFFRLAHERGKEIRATKSNLPILWGLLGPSLSAELKPAPVPAPTMPKSCQTCCTVEADVWPSCCDTNMSVGLDRTWTDVDGLGGRGWTRMGGAYVDGRGGRGLTWADGAGVDGACEEVVEEEEEEHRSYENAKQRTTSSKLQVLRISRTTAALRQYRNSSRKPRHGIRGY